MTPARKRIAWLSVAAVAFALVDRLVFPADRPDDAAAPSARSRSGATAMAASPRRTSSPAAIAAQTASDVDLGRLDRRQRELAGSASAAAAARPDPFNAVSWQVAASTAAPIPPPVVSAPTAPPFPYAYIGGLTDEGLRTAFFAKGERVLPVKAGDLVDAVYRVDQMSERQMKLTYLPLNQPLVVSLGGTP